MFLTERRARVALAPADLDPVPGRARLSYRRAEQIFTERTKSLAHPDIADPRQLAAAPGRKLHDLRHSALTHAAENGAMFDLLAAVQQGNKPKHDRQPTFPGSSSRTVRLAVGPRTRWRFSPGRACVAPELAG